MHDKGSREHYLQNDIAEMRVVIRRKAVSRLKEDLAGKNVLFVTTKELDYIRNVQEINMIRCNSDECYVAGSNSNKYWQRVLTAYFRSIKVCLSEKVDVVWVGFAPQLMRPLFSLYKQNKRMLYIDFFISLFDTMVCDRKCLKETSLFAQILFKLDKSTIQSADYFVADTKAHKNYFIDAFQVDDSHGEVLYLCADQSIYYPHQPNLPDELKDKFVVLYFGSILPLQGVEFVIKAISILKDINEIYFILIGPLEKMKEVALPVSDNVTCYSWLSQDCLAEKIAIADLCLAGHFNGNIEKAKRTIAGKTFIYQAMEKKIVLGDSPANRELFIEDENYCYVPMSDENELANCILSCFSEWKKIKAKEQKNVFG